MNGQRAGRRIISGDFIMPEYQFKCEKCKKGFSLTISISEYEKKKFRCPKCKSSQVKQQITPFQTKTSKKS
jgi:putative FmdB family regulatory protein